MSKYLESPKIFKALGDPKRTMIVDKVHKEQATGIGLFEKYLTVWVIRHK